MDFYNVVSNLEIITDEINFAPTKLLVRSVLEQFNITKYNLFNGIVPDFLVTFLIWVPFFTCIDIKFIYIKKYRFLLKIRNFLRHIFINFFKIIFSIFCPTPDIAKNYFFGRFVKLFIKTFFQLMLRKRLLVFLRSNSQIAKIKIQLGIQHALESNFGHAYPFTIRLYQYYPFILSIFVIIALTNLNGLLFYGFTNTAFLLQNFVFSFETVVGLTLLV